MSSRSRALVLHLLLGIVAYVALGWLRRDPRDPTDEHEWVAISIAHVEQLATREPPPGARADEPFWRSGVQATTFGAVNPCLPKLVWGAASIAAGHREGDPEVFQRFHLGDRDVERRARAKLDGALPLARNVVRAFAALAAVALFFVATSIAGPIAGAMAYAGFLCAPLVRLWSSFARTDFFMVALALATLAAAIAWRERIGGARGRGTMIGASALLGVLAGATVSSKLNGLPTIAFALGAIAIAWWRSPARSATGFARGPLLAMAVALAAACATVYVLQPVLWRHPIAEARAILAFWGPHMEFQQERAARLGVEVATTLGERVALVWRRTNGRDELLRGLLGAPGGVILIAAGLAALAAAALGRVRGLCHGSRTNAALALAFVALVAGPAIAWLPLDWDRYFLPLVPLWSLIEACAIGLFIRRLRAPGSASPIPSD